MGKKVIQIFDTKTKQTLSLNADKVLYVISHYDRAQIVYEGAFFETDLGYNEFVKMWESALSQ